MVAAVAARSVLLTPPEAAPTPAGLRRASGRVDGHPIRLAPRLDKPLPRFLDDAQAAAFMNAARALPDPLERLMVLLLARTGMRRGELLGLTVDSVVQIGTGYWLRTPVLDGPGGRGDAVQEGGTQSPRSVGRA